MTISYSYSILILWMKGRDIFMSINEATLQAYLSTLSTAKAEEFKKLSPEEQKKKINVFIEQTELAPTKTNKSSTTTKKQPINMTGDAPMESIGDEVSFSSKRDNTTSVAAQPTNQPTNQPTAA